MPRAKRKKFATCAEPAEAHLAEGAATLEQLVGATLRDHDEFAVLSAMERRALIGRLVAAIRCAHAGLKFRMRGVSDTAVVGQVFVHDIAAALNSAGITATYWRTEDGSGRQSLLFDLAQELAGDARVKLPTDLSALGRLSREWYGERYDFPSLQQAKGGL